VSFTTLLDVSEAISDSAEEGRGNYDSVDMTVIEGRCKSALSGLAATITSPPRVAGFEVITGGRFWVTGDRLEGRRGTFHEALA
jgi:hypothetical protein